MTKKQELKKAINERLKRYRKWATEARGLLLYLDYVPDLNYVEGGYYTNNRDEYAYEMPWDNEMVEKARQEIVAYGWKEVSNKQDAEWGQWDIKFVRIGGFEVDGGKIEIKFLLRACLNKKTATCVRTKIGEKVVAVTKDIYEVTCPEGADEMAMEVVE